MIYIKYINKNKWKTFLNFALKTKQINIMETLEQPKRAQKNKFK